MAKIDCDIIHFTYITYQSKTSLSIKYNLYIVLQTHFNCTGIKTAVIIHFYSIH